MLVSGIQQSESVIYTHIPSFLDSFLIFLNSSGKVLGLAGVVPGGMGEKSKREM